MVETSEQIDKFILSLKQSFAPQSKDEDPGYKWKLLKQLLSYYTCDNEVPKELLANYYNILSFLLDAVRPTLFHEKWEEEIFNDVFLKGLHHDAFMILVRRLADCSPSYAQDKILNLLQKFVQESCMQSMLIYQCISNLNWDLKYISSSRFWDDLISLIISLPERVANKTRGNMNKIFDYSFYIPLLTSSIMKVLGTIHEKITNCEDCTLEFLGKLIGRLCIAGHANVVVKKLSSDLIKVSESDFIWRRISQNLISKMPLSLLEAFITHLLLVIPWYGYVDWILGDTAINIQKLNYLITVKLLLIRHFKQDLILQNIIGYLASSESRKPHFFKALETVLAVWSDASTLKYQSFSQQCYLASALMIYVGWLKKINTEREMKDYMDKVLHGVQIRIGNSEQSVRNLGMIVGEHLTAALDPNTPKLDFELENSETLSHLKDLTNIPPKPEVSNSLFIGELKCFNEVEIEEKKWKELPLKDKEPQNVIATEELDSDDDLEPYDMSNDVSVEDTKRPLYVRDCMLGLIERDKPEWTEQCLRHAESLVRSNPDTVHEIAVEMTKILLHLDDSFSTPDFIGLRHRALISLAVLCPIQVAKYLTLQFYERDYNIRQRLDILEVLAAASQELSQLTIKITKSHPQYSKTKFVSSTEQNWKIIVDERIETKTRRFSHGPKKPVPVPEENKFSMAAGFFFFPLLEKYDRTGKMLNLLEDDSYVLGRLIYTLGIIMYSAINVPLARQMGSTFMKFLVAVRNQADVFVRQAAIFALTTVFISVPPFLLVSDLQDDVFESQQWLQHIIEKDPDVECQIKASRALGLLINIMKQEMPLLIDVTTRD